ncbi:hypothetical protein AGDE_15659 [Angomonas deanei]|uniref:Uncharacterized protein n=1 Tax=Angomonas deanei TaxID=59799 RepID=A0A7G2CG52_9TRYP|nr:hypothetical protein AGDE_15659 [Angomonas deanei]CAD2217844.1 hypothetical protein, conserved [Angomonas deanei]|eukprot:EPY18695.1 hypothetical protein AGDE_15659 [Angomonas deanei]
MKLFNRSWTDNFVVATLLLVSCYSAHGFYVYLFPQSLEAIASALFFVFWPLSPEDMKKQSNDTLPVKLGKLKEVSVWGWVLFSTTMFLVFMALWSYIMAVITPPGPCPAGVPSEGAS